MTPFEIRALLDELGRRLGDDVAKFWRTISGSVSSDEFRSMIVSAYPEIVTPYAASAAELGAEWYASQPSTSKYRPKVGDLPTVGRLEGSASWALAVGSGDAAVTLLQGAATRALFDGLRETVMTNVSAERGAKWARHASANACGWCRMIATRHVGDAATFYSSESDAGGDGNRYHDHCHCFATAIRPGQSYEPPAYVEKWNGDYKAAAKESGDPKVIARLMNPTH